jgi:hypothetical protein
MSAERALFDAYREWRRLAKAGNKAIGKRDWRFLLQCQSLARGIRASIKNLHRQAREEWQRSNVDCATKEKELRAVVSELKDLVESNQKLLRAARTMALAKRREIDQAGRNLKRLQGSYVSASPPAWTSVS